MSRIEAIKEMLGNDDKQYIKVGNEYITSWDLSMGRDTFESMNDEQVMELYDLEDN